MLYRAHNGMPEHTNGTGFAPGHVTSEAPVAIELCLLTPVRVEEPSGGIEHVEADQWKYERRVRCARSHLL